MLANVSYEVLDRRSLSRGLRILHPHSTMSCCTSEAACKRKSTREAACKRRRTSEAACKRMSLLVPTRVYLRTLNLKSLWLHMSENTAAFHGLAVVFLPRLSKHKGHFKWLGHANQTVSRTSTWAEDCDSWFGACNLEVTQTQPRPESVKSLYLKTHTIPTHLRTRSI